MSDAAIWWALGIGFSWGFMFGCLFKKWAAGRVSRGRQNERISTWSNVDP